MTEITYDMVKDIKSPTNSMLMLVGLYYGHPQFKKGWKHWLVGKSFPTSDIKLFLRLVKDPSDNFKSIF